MAKNFILMSGGYHFLAVSICGAELCQSNFEVGDEKKS
jgi:hypothetical protein